MILKRARDDDCFFLDLNMYPGNIDGEKIERFVAHSRSVCSIVSYCRYCHIVFFSYVSVKTIWDHNYKAMVNILHMRQKL